MVHTTAPFVGLSTSWAKAPVNAAALGAVGGGCVLSPTRLLLWRVHGDVLTLCEETLAAPELEANRVAVALASPAPRGGSCCCRVFAPSAGSDRVVVAVATAGHAHVLYFPPTAGASALARACRERHCGGVKVSLDAVLGGPGVAAPAAARWAAPRGLLLPLAPGRGGGVAAVQLGDAAELSSFRVLRDGSGARGVVGRLVAGLVGAPSGDDEQGLTVVAVCAGGDGSSLERCVVAGLRADWRLGVWLGSTGALAHSLDLRETLRGDGVAPRLGPGTRLVGVEGNGGFAVAAVLDDAPIPALALIDAGVATDGTRNPAAAVVARLDAPRWRDGAPAQAAELRCLEASGGTLWSYWARDRPPTGAPSCDGDAALLASHAIDGGAPDVAAVAHAPALGGARAARRDAGDAALEAKAAAASWASLFGGEDGWPAASAAIEAHFLKRLCLPGRFTARALGNALAYGLPSVLRRDVGPDAVVDGALDACRDAFRRSLRDDRASLEVKCAALCGAWRSFLHLADAQAVAESAPLGFVSSTNDAVVAAPPLCAAAGLQQLLPRLEHVRWTAAALETHCRAPALAPLLAAPSAEARDLGAALDALLATRDPDAAHRVAAEARAAAATHAAADPAFAAACAAAAGGGDATPFSVSSLVDEATAGRLLAGALAPAGGDHAYARNAPSALARAGLAAAAAAAAEDLYGAAVAVAAAALLGVAAGGAGEPLADASLAVARDLRVTAWLASDAPADGAAPRKARRVSFADGRDDRAHWLDRREPALAGLLAPDGQLVEGGGPGNAFLDRCAAAARVAGAGNGGGAYLGALAAGAAWSGVLGPGSPSRLDVYLRESGQPAYASLRRRRQLAARSGDVAAAAEALGDAEAARGGAARLEAAAAAYAARLALSGDDLAFTSAKARMLRSCASDARGRAAAARLARLAPKDDGDAGLALDAWAFELDLQLGDWGRAAAKANTDPGERVPRLARELLDRGAAARLVAAPWGDGRALVDAALLKLARRDPVDDAFAADFLGYDDRCRFDAARSVDAYKVAAALRVGARDFAGAAAVFVEVAGRLDGLHSPKATAAALAADAAADACLAAAPASARFVAQRPARGGDALALTCRDDLAARNRLRRSRLRLGGSRLGPRDAALELARRGNHGDALDAAQPLGPDVEAAAVFALAGHAAAGAPGGEFRDDRSRVYAESTGGAPAPGPLGAPVASTPGDRAEAVLEAALARDGVASNFGLCRAAAAPYLAAGGGLPPFLHDRMAGAGGPSFAGRGGDAPRLVALYLDHGRLADACAAAAFVLAEPPSTNGSRPEAGNVSFLPVALLDDLQDACDAALESGDRGDLRGAYDAFLAALDARLDACANDVVAAAAERGILA